MRQKILDLLHKSQKIILGSLLFTVYSLFSNAQSLSTDKNAVIEYRARISTTDPNALHSPTSAVINVQYFDGLGRPLQTVGYGQSPTQKDIVSGAVQYDNYGRQVRSYLPTPTTVSAGGYQNNVAGLGQSFYGDNHAFEVVDAFDNSPLNRVKRSYGAGQAWKTAGKYKAVYYETAGTDVRLYTLEASGTILFSGYYPSNSLFKTRFIDEQGHTTIEIKDIDGRLVEKHTEETSGGTSGFLITHYLYDGSDRIRAVIQPNGYAQGTHFYYNDSNYQNAIFAYEYNDGGNLARKHIPNGGWTSYVYDRGDRPVLEQNAQQATQGKWSFTKYDVFGRTIIEGELTNYNDRSTLQNWFDNNVTTPYETWNGAGYSSQSFPIGYNATDEKKWFFYDGYNWMSGTLAFNASLAYNPSSYWSNASGLPTGSWSRDPQNTALVYHTVYHYDNKGRMLQTYQVHQKGGNQPWLNPIITNYEYNFAGEVTKEKTIYKIDGQADTEALTWNEYDHVGRLLKIYHGINSSTPTEIVRLNYDEIGRLTQKKIMPNGTYLYSGIPDYINRPPNPNVGIDDVAKKAICLLPGTDISNTYSATIDPNANSGTPISGLQTIQYTYHIRGGLRGINLDGSGNAVPNAGEGDLFSYKLDYETANQWDGNIGKQTWRNDTESQRSYLYTYDPAKRLKSATYQGIGTENFSIPNMSYDKNGNIKQLMRYGKIGNGFGLIDNLTYFHTGNRLSQVFDNQPTTSENEFVQRGGANYTYYPDGSLKSDANEQIANIVYDTYLKQQKEVYLTDGRKLLHFYDGGGTLLKTVYYSAQNTVLETWEFLPHGMVYKNGLPYQLTTPEGRAVWNGTSWNYEFDYKDHLGNTRVSFKEASGVLVKTAETAFDPYGVRLNGIGSVNSFQNRWELQGHEKESTFGLNRINFGARTVNPTTGVWDRIDPLAELDFNLGAYTYVGNNPINAVDLWGMKRKKINEDTYEETVPFDEVTVTAKRNNVNAAFGFDLMYQAHARNKREFGDASPYQKHFQDGGAIAAGVAAAPLAIIAAAEAGAGAAASQGLRYLTQLNYASAGRWALRTSKFILNPRVVFGFKNFNYTGAVADFGVQYLTNGHSLEDVNYVSVGGNLVFNNPLWSGAITTISSNETDRTFSNFMINSAGNALGSGPGLLFEQYSKVGLKVTTAAGANARANFMGNVVSRGVAESVKNQKNE